MSFRLVLKSVTLSDLGVMVLTLRYFNEFVTPAVELITAFSCIELIDLSLIHI